VLFFSSSYNSNFPLLVFFLTSSYLSLQWYFSLFLTWAIGSINALGYVVIVAYLAINEVPIVIRQTDQWVEEGVANPSVRTYYNYKAFNWAWVTLAGIIM
jgi:hypothetical protein